MTNTRSLLINLTDKEDDRDDYPCGCFGGTLEEFAEKVKDTHGDSRFAKEYLAAIEVVKIHFEIEEDEENA